MKLLPERVSVLVLSEFLLSLACFIGSALAFYGFAGLEDGRLAGLAIAALSVIAGCFFTGLYRNLQWRSRISLILQLCSVFGLVLLMQGAFAYVGTALEVARWVTLLAVSINFLAMLGWRIAYAGLLKALFPVSPILFLGVDDVVCEIADAVAARPELGYSVAGFLSETYPPGSLVAGGGKVEGRIEDLPLVLGKLHVRRIVAGMEEMRRHLPVADLVAAKRKGIAVGEAGSAYELVCGRVCSRTFRPSQIIFGNELGVSPGVMALQSIYSNLLGLVAFICAVPVLAAARAIIRLSSRGPALISEQYAGMKGIPFTASRLRCTDVDHPLRVTAAGRWIRALHLEYLPRIGNVVRGEMSLVGPAPVRLEFAEHLSSLIPVYRQRQTVKPGLTGWTQIQVTEKDLPDAIREVESDLYYTKHMSVALDAYILLHALRGVLPFLED
jgi:lipopolysaccharide/colanic/teichoic acid biosynthesis glycosyltransferase